jgi:hypothetical protein
MSGIPGIERWLQQINKMEKDFRKKKIEIKLEVK